MAVVHMRYNQSQEEKDLDEAREIGQIMWQIGRVRNNGRPLEECAVKPGKAVCVFSKNGERKFLIIEEANRP